MDDWRKMGPKNGENARRYAKKGYKPVPVGIKNAPRSWGERVIIPQSAALTAPFTREPNRLQNLSPPCKGGSGVAAGGIAPEVNLIVMWVDKNKMRADAIRPYGIVGSQKGLS